VGAGKTTKRERKNSGEEKSRTRERPLAQRVELCAFITEKRARAGKGVWLSMSLETVFGASDVLRNQCLMLFIYLNKVSTFFEEKEI